MVKRKCLTGFSCWMAGVALLCWAAQPLNAALEADTTPGVPAGFEIDGTQRCGDASAKIGGPGDDWGKANGGGCVGVAMPADGISTAQFTDCNWGSAGDRGDATQFGSGTASDGSNTNFDKIGCPGRLIPYLRPKQHARQDLPG